MSHDPRPTRGGHGIHPAVQTPPRSKHRAFTLGDTGQLRSGHRSPWAFVRSQFTGAFFWYTDSESDHLLTTMAFQARAQA